MGVKAYYVDPNFYSDQNRFDYASSVFTPIAGTFNASHNSQSVYFDGKGGDFILNITTAPGVQTVTYAVQGLVDGDKTLATWYTILTSAAFAATGTNVISIYPGLAAVANVSANALVPGVFRLAFTHSGGSNFTYSCSCNLHT